MGDLSPRKARERHREQVGKDAYRRFADAMAEFRAAIAEMEEASRPREIFGPHKPKKIITPLRANGYRPMANVERGTT